MRKYYVLLVSALLAILFGSQSFAGSSEPFSNPALTATLISAEDGVAPDAGTLSIGLDLELHDGWKVYWRTPGEVGFPPEIIWDESENLASADMLWPAPKRFTAFGIENFGYDTRVVLPIRVMLKDPGAAVNLQGQISLLSCADICVPHDFELSLTIPAGTGIDSGSASLITEFAALVPVLPSNSDISVIAAALDGDALTITATSDTPFSNPDIFPELGEEFTFGKPDVRTSPDGKQLWARLPVLAKADVLPDLDVTITDADRAAAFSPEWSDIAPQPPFQIVTNIPGFFQVMFIAAVAFLGGLILNVMPCVLPVLSIKLASVMGHQNKSTTVIRNGFLMSALGVLAFMWVLALSVLALQSFGVTVGWGLQFQNPVFLALMFMVLAIFSANLFGVFEISLPSGMQTKMANSGARDGYIGDFATGAFAAVLATPCSAPFLGTAIAFALTGRPIDVLIVFTALGLGLALPYLLFATRPALVSHLPKPGKWMVLVKTGLGALLVLTAVWLLWVLSGVAGQLVAMIVLGFAITFVVFVRLPQKSAGFKWAVLTGLALVPLLVAATFTQTPSAPKNSAQWVEFQRSEIPKLVSQGQVVFLDFTADWCLTCKANKALVLDRDPVASLLQEEGTVAMQADWTRPNDAIAKYLESHGRFGIPFNIVFGPGAPDGIILSELLTTQAVMTALEDAAGQKTASN